MNKLKLWQCFDNYQVLYLVYHEILSVIDIQLVILRSYHIMGIELHDVWATLTNLSLP